MTDTENQAPDFTAYTRDHWSCLLYIETRVVDNNGNVDSVRMNEADYEAIDDMERDGLIAQGKAINSEFSLTDVGWTVAHAIRRARAERVDRNEYAAIASSALDSLNIKRRIDALEEQILGNAELRDQLESLS